ncbi:hypothetical protein L9F63_006604, partial [Diploptera punctata]
FNKVLTLQLRDVAGKLFTLLSPQLLSLIYPSGLLLRGAGNWLVPLNSTLFSASGKLTENIVTICATNLNSICSPRAHRPMTFISEVFTPTTSSALLPKSTLILRKAVWTGLQYMIFADRSIISSFF